MQDTTNLLLQAIRYESPSELPVFVGILPAAMKKYDKELKELFKEYPDFFGDYFTEYDYEKNLPFSYHTGNFTDAWGCVWSNEIEGMESYVTGHPIPHREDILTLKAPTENMGFPHGFMYLRLCDLRGFEEVMMDFAEEPPELQMLIDTVCDYNVLQMSLLCEKDKSSKLVIVGDDLGMQIGLAIGADKWRKYLKPAFKKIYDVAHKAGKLVYMHTDGDIISIMPDLVEAGVNIINPQFRANGIDNLVKTCKGKIPICLDLDRQLFPFATPEELRIHVSETVKKMYLPTGGLGINLELSQDIPFENIAALVDEVYKMRFYKGN